MMRARHHVCAGALVRCLSLLGALGLAPAAVAQNIWDETTAALSQPAEMPEGWQFEDDLFALLDLGEALFEAKFTALDGAGRPNATQAALPNRPRKPLTQAFSRTSGPDASACSSCHNAPLSGGAGDYVTNVFTSSGFANAVFETTDPELSNERGTNHLFGSGLVELLAREMTRSLQDQREQALATAREQGSSVRVDLSAKGIGFGTLVALPDGLVDASGVEGVDPDLIIKPFTHKGVIRSLRQFTVTALNHHSGMQATERFGARWTGETDFDGDGYLDEMNAGQIAALVAWQATLPPPGRATDLPDEWQAAATRGEALFSDFGCSSCHVAALPLESLDFHDPGPLDTAGTLNSGDVRHPAIYDLTLLEWSATLPRNEDGHVMVPLFGDLKRHRMTDAEVNGFGNERVVQGFVDTNVFMTTELWGVGSTAPFGHRNDMTTMDQAIRAHGGDSRASHDAYVNADPAERSAIIAFLKSLIIEDETDAAD